MRISDWSSDVCSSDLHNVYWKPVLDELNALKSLYPSGNVASHVCLAALAACDCCTHFLCPHNKQRKCSSPAIHWVAEWQKSVESNQAFVAWRSTHQVRVWEEGPQVLKCVDPCAGVCDRIVVLCAQARPCHRRHQRQ